jgi:hypothetical protein
MRKRIIVFAGVILCLTFVAIGYHLYNKPRTTAAGLSADKAVSAKELFDAFTKDEQAAGVQYGNKVLEISGAVLDVQKSGKDVSVLLSGGGSDGGVNCTMAGDVPAPRKGSLIHVKGRCTGFLMDVSIIDATIVNK